MFIERIRLAGISFIVQVCYRKLQRSSFGSSAVAVISPAERIPSANLFWIYVSLAAYVTVRYMEYKNDIKSVAYTSPIDGFSDYATFRI